MIMGLVIRQKGSRRWRQSAEFPSTDSQGLFVIQDRKRLPDRRKAEYGLDDMKVIFEKMAKN